MNPDTTKIIDRLVLSRDGLRKLDIADYAMIREAREAMADAANALTNYAKTFSVIQEADQVAAPHLYPASGEVGEAVGRMSGLVQVIDSGAIPGISTPVLREDLNNILLALSSERERAERAELALEQFHEGNGWTANYVAQRLYDEKVAAEARAQAAEAKVKDSLRDLLAEAYLAGATDVHENYRPDPDPEFGEAAHDYAEAAALRWTETQGEGE